MKKKFLIAAALLVMTFSICAFGACANADGETKTLTLWHYYNNDQLTAFNAIVDEFNATAGKQKKIVVKPLSVGYVNDVAQQVIKSAKETPGAEKMPDIFMVYADTAFTVDKLGKVAALDDYFSDDELADYVDGFIDEGRFDGTHLKIFPIAKSTEILMLNRTDWDRFAAATPDVSLDDLATTEGVIRVAELYYEWSGGQAFYGRDSLSNYFIIGAKSLGIDLMYRDAEGNFRFNFDEAALRRLWDNYFVPYVKGYFYANSKFRSGDVSAGKILAYTGSTSSSLFFPKKVQVDDENSYPITHLTMPAPKFADGADVAVQQGAGLVVAKSDKKTEAACAEFLKWITAKDVNAEFSVASSYMPVKKSTLQSDYLDRQKDLDARCYDALTVSRQITENNLMYTNIPSLYSNDVRGVLDTHIEAAAKAAKARYDAQIEAGATREDALAPLISEAAFSAWLADFRAAVTAVYS